MIQPNLQDVVALSSPIDWLCAGMALLVIGLFAVMFLIDMAAAMQGKDL